MLSNMSKRANILYSVKKITRSIAGTELICLIVTTDRTEIGLKFD